MLQHSEILLGEFWAGQHAWCAMRFPHRPVDVSGPKLTSNWHNALCTESLALVVFRVEFMLKMKTSSEQNKEWFQMLDRLDQIFNLCVSNRIDTAWWCTCASSERKMNCELICQCMSPNKWEACMCAKQTCNVAWSDGHPWKNCMIKTDDISCCSCITNCNS